MPASIALSIKGTVLLVLFLGAIFRSSARYQRQAERHSCDAFEGRHSSLYSDKASITVAYRISPDVWMPGLLPLIKERDDDGRETITSA